MNDELVKNWINLNEVKSTYVVFGSDAPTGGVL